MEKELERSVFAFLWAIALSALCAFICGVGFVLGNLQAVLYSVILEMCCLFIVGVFVDNFQEECD